MTNKRFFFGMFSVFALFTLLTFHTFGQSPPLPDGINPVGATNGAPANTPAVTAQDTATSMVMTLIPVIVPLLIAGKKKLLDLMAMPQFPSWILPLLAVGLSELLNYFAALEHHGVGPGLGAILGLAGIGLRETLTQVKGRMSNASSGAQAATASVIVGALLIGFVATGCNGRLENGGAYAPGTNVVTTTADGSTTTNFVPTVAPDYAFFEVDAAFDFAYSTIDAIFTFERDNRAMLWQISPDIKHTLDSIRPNAVLARNQYIAARVAYMKNPVPANLSTLQSLLAKVQQLVPTVQAAIPPSIKLPTTPTPKTK